MIVDVESFQNDAKPKYLHAQSICSEGVMQKLSGFHIK